jgi:hypothetical protein
MRTRSLLIAIVAPTLLLLAACAPAASSTPAETYAPATDPAANPGAIPTLGPADPDTTLVVNVTATTANGSQLSLVMRVHQSIAYDDVASQTLPKAMVEDCPTLFTQELFKEQSWSFTRANVTAIPTAASKGDWPTDARVTLRPSATTAVIAGRGSLADSSASTTLPCKQDKSFVGYGTGGLALGAPGDSGTFTKWANHAWGFVAPAGVTLNDCTFEVTALGSKFGGGAASWVQTSNATTCVTGASPEAQEY